MSDVNKEWLESELNHIKGELHEIKVEAYRVTGRVDALDKTSAEHATSFRFIFTVFGAISTGLTSAIAYLWGK